MKAVLAGFNIDSELIKEINRSNLATPETLSAAYARISRSQKDVTTLRKDALSEVDKARSSNENIIFDMGHSSVAEHAVFNFDIIGVSRVLSEIIQKSRLASFTEKSQRYVTLKGDFVIPPEIKDTDLEQPFIQLIENQNTLYTRLFEKAVILLENEGLYPVKRELEGKAKEDARYVLSLATATQMGMTINARSLERLLCRLDACGLDEGRELKQLIEDQVKNLAPSIIKYTGADYCGIKRDFVSQDITELPVGATLTDFSDNAQEKILCADLFENHGYDYEDALNTLVAMNNEEIEAYFDDLTANMKSYHTLPKVFEMADYTFELTMSSSCFGQLKRHRLSTVLKSGYHPKRGFVIPSLLKKLNLDVEINEVIKASEEMFYHFEKLKKGLGVYCLTNAHKINVIMKANLREWFHFVRLRSDAHAQWEIKLLSDEIMKQIKEKHPLATKQMMGKDAFHKLNQ